jgi:four helix bundle protein
MQDYRNIRVWKDAHQLVLEIYRTTNNFPDDERFGLVSQMRRSAASIPTNIAEGSSRGSDLDFARFLTIALGSSAELDYQLLLSYELQYLSEADYNKLNIALASVRKMLNAFITKLRANS